jgi:hypothetical protein
MLGRLGLNAVLQRGHASPAAHTTTMGSDDRQIGQRILARSSMTLLGGDQSDEPNRRLSTRQAPIFATKTPTPPKQGAMVPRLKVT